MTPDRERKDRETRDRVDEIAAAMNAYRQRLDARYRRVVVLVIVALAALAVAGLFIALTYQGQRWRATRDSCDRENMRTEATIAVLRDSHVPAGVITLAERRFPRVPPHPMPRGYTGPMTCGEYATDRVSGPRL